MGRDSLISGVRISRYILIFAVVGVVLAYFINFRFFVSLPLGEKADSWGQFGDYFGGLLNPLIASFAFYWLTQSVLIQKEELKDTRAELCEARKAQEFQAKMQFFSSQISGYKARLENIMADQKAVREDIIFLRESLRTAPFINLQGSQVTGGTIRKDLEDLLDKSRLYNEMRETIDNHIKGLIRQIEDINNLV